MTDRSREESQTADDLLNDLLERGDVTELLANLREVHLPEPIIEPPLWPVILAVLLLVVFLVAFGSKFWSARRSWVVEVENSIAHLKSSEPEAALQGYATLLKRIALTIGNDNINIRQLSGQGWLEYLDLLFNTDYFTNGAGRIFGLPIYQSPQSRAGSNPNVAEIGDSILRLVHRKGRGK